MWPIPALWLYGAAFLAGLAVGGYGAHTWHKAQTADAVQQARQDERELQKKANQADTRYQDELHLQRLAAEANAAKFRRALDEKNRALAECRVDYDLLRVLDDAAMSGSAGRAAEPRPATPRAEAPPDGNCAREFDTCRANYAEVCVPNALQLRELQQFTRDLIRDYRRATGTP